MNSKTNEQIGAGLQLENISKHYGTIKAVDNVDIDISPGEFLTLLGPSGSGKTTTLMLIAGFIEATRGRIFLDGESLEHKPPNKRNIGMVFQNYALFPHMSVEENITFPLKMRKNKRADIEEKVPRILSLVGMPGHEKRRIDQLSGGQQQRVALARALVYNPPLLLMDEPLGALDRKLREQMQLEIKHIQKASNITVVYVTHDQEEALIMSDRMGIMKDGRLIQMGSPLELYESPQYAFVADFLGESNLLEGYLVENTGETTVARLANSEIRIRGYLKTDFERERKVSVMNRPEKVFMVRAGDHYDNLCKGNLEELIFVGDVIKYMVRLDNDAQLMLKVPNTAMVKRLEVGQEVTVGWDIDGTYFLD